MGPAYSPLPVPQLRWPYYPDPDFVDEADSVPLGRIESVAGATFIPASVGLLGFRPRYGQPVGVHLGPGLAVGFFGGNRTGKTYAKGVLLEMSIEQLSFANVLKRPACALEIHYHPSGAYPPEMLHSVFPNIRPGETQRLIDEAHALPQGLKDVVLLTLPAQVDRLRAQHPHVQVQGLTFALADLGLDELMVLLGMEDNKSLYGKQVEVLLRQLVASGRRMTWLRLLRGVLRFPFTASVREKLLSRLELVRPWVDDRYSLRELIQPGRLILVDIRDGWLTREQALALVALVLRVMALHPDQREEGSCGLVVALDEVQKLMRSKLVARQVEALLRERRHLSLTLLLMSQDPLCIRGELLTLFDIVGVYRTAGGGWLSHLQRHIAAFRELKAEVAAKLPVGTMVMWAKEWHVVAQDHGEDYEGLVVLRTRTRVTLHGGETPGL